MIQLIPKFILFWLLVTRIISYASLPPDIITAIVTSHMTSPLIAYVVPPADNFQNTDAMGNTMLFLAAQNSFAYFTTQLYNLNRPGFATIINKQNNAGVTPLKAAVGNPQNSRYMVQFLLRKGATVGAQTNSLGNASLSSQPGSLDPSFGNGAGFVNIPQTGAVGFATAIQLDGKIVVVGTNMAGATITVRYNIDGTLDTTFGVEGVVTDATGMFGASVIIQLDGKIIIGGSDALDEKFQLIRYNTDGTIDTTFSGGSVIGPDGSGFTLALQSDGKIIMAGTNNNDRLFEVVRYNTDGSIDTIFERGPSEFAQAIAVQYNGKIVVAGISSTFKLELVRYNTDGTLDTGFVAGAAPAGIFSGLLLQPDGKLVTIGNTFVDFTNPVVPNILLARFNTDGSLDTFFGGGVITGPAGIANDAVLQLDGKIVIVGLPTVFGPTFQLIRYTTAGNIDPSFGTNGIVEAPSGAAAYGCATLQLNGGIVAVGSNPTFTIQVARYIGGPAVTPITIEFVDWYLANVIEVFNGQIIIPEY